MSVGLALPLSLDRLLDNTLDGIFALDRERRFVVFNRACERITGYSSGEILGTSCACHDVVDCHDDYGRSLAGALCPTRRLMEEDSPDGARQRMRLRRKDGTTVWVETIYTPLRDQGGETKLILGIMRDVSEAREREQELVATATKLREDIPYVVHRLIEEFNQSGTRQIREVSPRAWKLLNSYDWPGNVRELSAAIEAAYLAGSGPILRASDLPETVRAEGTARGAHEGGESLALDPLLERVERQAILAALERAKGQRNLAARLMGISRSRLYRRMEALGITSGDGPGSAEH